MGSGEGRSAARAKEVHKNRNRPLPCNPSRRSGNLTEYLATKRGELQKPARADRISWSIGGVLLLLAAALPLRFCGQSLFFDEVWTLEHYARTSFQFITTDFEYPNNHIGFSILLRTWLLAAGLLNTDIAPDWLLRVPVLLGFMIAVGVVFLCARRLLDRNPVTAAGVALLFASIQIGIEHCFQMRGYCPSAMWIALALWLTVSLPTGISRERKANSGLRRLVAQSAALCFCLFGALYTLPTNMWIVTPFCGGAAVWLILRTRVQWATAEVSPVDANISRTVMKRAAKTRRKTVVAEREQSMDSGVVQKAEWLIPISAMGTAYVAAFIAYQPVIEQIRKMSTPAGDFSAIIRRVPEMLDRLFSGLRFAGSSTWTVVLLGTGLACVAYWAIAMRKPAASNIRRSPFVQPWAVLLLCCPVILSPVLASITTGTLPFYRNFYPAAPFAAIIMAAGVLGVAHAVGTGTAKLQYTKLSGEMTTQFACAASIAGVAIFTYWSGLSNGVQFENLHQPRQLAEYAKSLDLSNALVGIDAPSDNNSFYRYARQRGFMDRVYYCESIGFPPDKGARTVYLLAGNSRSLQTTLKNSGLTVAGRCKAITRVAHIGRTSVIKVELNL